LGEQFREIQEEQALSALSAGSTAGIELDELINQIQSNDLMRNKLDSEGNIISNLSGEEPGPAGDMLGYQFLNRNSRSRGGTRGNN